MNEIVSFGEWVQRRRNQLHYSRTELARQVGCSTVTIKKIERDERRPSHQIAQLLAEHLQIPAEEQEGFVRRARGEYVARLVAPQVLPLQVRSSLLAIEQPTSRLPQVSTEPELVLRVAARDQRERQQDWGEAPDVSSFYGRHDETNALRAWLVDDGCRLVGLLGMGGIGKTALVTWLAEQVQDEFDYLIWRSLRNGPLWLSF